jgi:O-antigen/teichoic acid export membrane protein
MKSTQLAAPEQPIGTPAMGGVARGSSANLVGIAVLASSTLMLTIAVSHWLTKEAAGVFFATTSLFVLATITSQLGTDTALVYFLSRARGKGQAQLAGRYVRLARSPVLVVSVAMGIAVFIFAPELSAAINPDQTATSTNYLRVLAFFIPMASLEVVTLAATRGLASMRANVMIEQLGRPLLQLALVIVVLALGWPGWLALAWAVGYAPALLAAGWWWRRVRPPASVEATEQPSQSDLRREFWRFSGPRALASMGQSAMQRLDIILVAALAGAAAAAIYTASTRFLVVGQMGTRAISLAVQPRLGEALGRRDLVAAKHYYQIATAWLVLITWPMFIIFAIFGRQLLNIFGSGYQAGQQVMMLLSLVMLIATGCGMVDMVLNMAGRTSWNMANVFLSIGVQTVIDVLLIPSRGIWGAALGWAAAIVLSNVVPLIQITLSLGLHPFGRATLLAMMATTCCFGVVGGLTRATMGLSWLSVTVAVVAGAVIYLPGLWLMRNALELTALRGIRSRRT